jgi:hypothetical protein
VKIDFAFNNRDLQKLLEERGNALKQALFDRE